jgi:hypothetical protein
MPESDFQADRPHPPPPREVMPIEDVRPAPPPLQRPRRPGYEVRTSSNAPAPGSGIETLIPYHNPLGLTAYYLGVFSLIPCLGLLLGPAGLITGIMGIRAQKANPAIGGVGHAITGIVLGSLTTLGNYAVLIIWLVAVVFASHR